jgi:arylsulfatase
MPVIFTGEWPVDRTVEGDSVGASNLVARRERIRAHMEARDTLPEKMRRLGYTTAAFTPNPFTSRHFGFDQGFDHFQDFMDESNRGSLYQRVFDGFLEGSGASSLARVFMNFWQREEVFKPWESYYDEVIEWAESAEEPYFLWVFLMDAHNPYMSSAEYRTQSRLSEFYANVEFWRQSHETPFSDGVHEKLVTAYDDSIRYSDAFLGRLRSDLGGDDPTIVVHGDHGEAFGEHGTYGHEPYLHEENVRVPLVVSGQGKEQETCSEPMTLRDLDDLLMAVATETVSDRDWGRELVTVRSDQGATVAAHTRDGTAISSLAADGLSSSAPGDEWIDGHLEPIRERTRVAETASAVGRDVE